MTNEGYFLTNDTLFWMKKNQQVYKPGFVSQNYGISIIYLALKSPQGSCDPPPGMAGPTLTPVYMVLQPISRTAFPVTRKTGELLPHLLTLICLRQTVIFFSDATLSRKSSS